MKKIKPFFGLIIRRERIIARPFLTGLLFFIFVFFALLLFGSCGLETFIYLEPVAIVDNPDTSFATVYLPNQSAMEFQNYIIYYRIYLSDRSLNIITNTYDQRNLINPSLAADYRYLEPYTVDDYVPSSSLHSYFWNRGYRLLDVDEAELSNELGRTGSGSIEFNFAPPSGDPPPRMTVIFGSSSGPFYLSRDTNANPDPARYHFRYNQELGTISTTHNTDVATTEQASNAYVSMYIVASGIDNSFSSVYSRPEHIGIFLLPASL